MEKKENGSLPKGMGAFTLGSTIAIQFAAAVLLGLWGGRFLDSYLGTDPWLMLVGLLAGLGAATMSVYRLVSRYLN
ncbi:MAG: AtpZ/AtpI family protein [Eubacteriales bacterium]|jgi:F0F1-type ATP synthase assembly protein I|nr:AtpZ/AtpI family protein [Bacillota bacterium]MBV1727510.1 AtpZ/AtpI family protein [Desulforudis sp.]MDP3050009.1 AtpZ/AtpI family protein [Eubacteriales bacterium]MDQ7789891.1 AtpZ/AtpI family protein [Clostridia bacterium]MBU4534186.1 AtpZ/AtpI family protein [Bacillota bacterium]